MRQFRTMLLLAVFGCGGAAGADPSKPDGAAAGAAQVDTLEDTQRLTNGGAGGSEEVGAGGSDSVANGGTSAGAGGDEASQGGTGGVVATGGSSQGGTDSSVAGAGGSTAGTGGSDQGGTGGSSTPPPDPPPAACTFDLDHGGPGTRCSGLLFETCTLVDGVAQYSSTQCGTADVGFNCDYGGGCNGDCQNGAGRCTGQTAETCVSGAWETTEVCSYQCVNGACAGACTPGEAFCDGGSVVTCGQDFHYGNAVACDDAPNATATCSGAGVCGTACVPGFADCSAAAGCETDLSSPDSCGSCGNICPGAPNATRTCNGGVCGLQPIPCSAGTANCTGDFVCETDTDTDVNNCGGCGVQCVAGSTCASGQCSIQTVATLAGNPSDLVAEDLVVGPAYVYWWTTDGFTNVIWRAPKDGSGSAESLTTFSGWAARHFGDELLYSGGQLFWATLTGVFRMADTGGTVTPISNSGARGLAIADGKLYWNDVGISFANNCLDTYPTDHNTEFLYCNNRAITFYTYDIGTQIRTQWTTNQFEYSSVLGVSGTELYAARFQAVYNSHGGQNHYYLSIVALNTATGVVSKNITDYGLDGGVVVSFNEVLGDAALSGTTLVFDISGQLYRASTTAYGGATVLGTDGGADLAVDATNVYTERVGALAEVLLSNGASHTLFSQPGQRGKVTVEGGLVYWTAQVGQQLLILRSQP